MKYRLTIHVPHWTCYEIFSVEIKGILVIKCEKNIIFSMAFSAFSSSNLRLLCTSCIIKTYYLFSLNLSGFQLTYFGGEMMKRKNERCACIYPGVIFFICQPSFLPGCNSRWLRSSLIRGSSYPLHLLAV